VRAHHDDRSPLTQNIVQEWRTLWGALALDVIHRQADDPARLASAVGRQALDVPSSSWANADES